MSGNRLFQRARVRRGAVGGLLPVRLVPLDVSHAAALQLLVSDPLVALPAGLPEALPELWAYHFIERRAAAQRCARAYTFAIERRTDGCLLGSCSVHSVSVPGRHAELAFLVGRPFWGRGYGRLAAEHLVKLALGSRWLSTLRARALASNAGALRILWHCGFHKTEHGFPSEGRSRHDAALAFELNLDAWKESALAGRIAGGRSG